MYFLKTCRDDRSCPQVPKFVRTITTLRPTELILSEKNNLSIFFQTTSVCALLPVNRASCCVADNERSLQAPSL